jgi:hypothetical protein
VPRKKTRIFVYYCDYCGKQHDNINAGSDYLVYASKQRFCREPDCWSLYMKQKKEEQDAKTLRNEEKRQRVYGKKIFSEKEKEKRKVNISKLEEYLNYLKKGKHEKRLS